MAPGLFFIPVSKSLRGFREVAALFGRFAPAPLTEMRGALEADQQAAERRFDVGICRMHHINNNAGVATVTVVQMRAGGVTH